MPSALAEGIVTSQLLDLWLIPLNPTTAMCSVTRRCFNHGSWEAVNFAVFAYEQQWTKSCWRHLYGETARFNDKVCA